MKLKCKGRIHGELQEDGLLEVRCTHLACTGGQKRAFVLHHFDPKTGQLKDTSQPYRNPLKETPDAHR